MHHWAALLFMAAIVVHMLRIFFTGAFRKPRELNWMIGFTLFWLGFVEGCAGYSLPDDGLSGTGLRIADSIILSIPRVGTWISFAVFGGSSPGDVIMGRLYIVHVFLVPGLILALIALHLALVVKLKHTQWAGPGRTERNVVGTRVLPGLLFLAGFTYPFLERFRSHDTGWHNLLVRPRDRPDRTGLGAMAVTFYLVLTLAGADDVISEAFRVSLDATVWAGRILLLLLPPLAYYAARRMSLWGQQQDRVRLRHGIETGIIVRQPDGHYEELHQPLGEGALDYRGAAVPKRPNQIGAVRRAIKGFYLPVEPVDQPAEAPTSPAASGTAETAERAGEPSARR
jgi:quinol-cytochrome oxidoreductase complex cytochrome b subunit